MSIPVKGRAMNRNAGMILAALLGLSPPHARGDEPPVPTADSTGAAVCGPLTPAVPQPGFAADPGSLVQPRPVDLSVLPTDERMGAELKGNLSAGRLVAPVKGPSAASQGLTADSVSGNPWSQRVSPEPPAATPAATARKYFTGEKQVLPQDLDPRIADLVDPKLMSDPKLKAAIFRTQAALGDIHHPEVENALHAYRLSDAWLAKFKENPELARAQYVAVTRKDPNLSVDEIVKGIERGKARLVREYGETREGYGPFENLTKIKDPKQLMKTLRGKDVIARNQALVPLVMSMDPEFAKFLDEGGRIQPELAARMDWYDPFPTLLAATPAAAHVVQPQRPEAPLYKYFPSRGEPLKRPNTFPEFMDWIYGRDLGNGQPAYEGPDGKGSVWHRVGAQLFGHSPDKLRTWNNLWRADARGDAVFSAFAPPRSYNGFPAIDRLLPDESLQQLQNMPTVLGDPDTRTVLAIHRGSRELLTALAADPAKGFELYRSRGGTAPDASQARAGLERGLRDMEEEYGKAYPGAMPLESLDWFNRMDPVKLHGHIIDGDPAARNKALLTIAARLHPELSKHLKNGEIPDDLVTDWSNPWADLEKIFGELPVTERAAHLDKPRCGPDSRPEALGLSAVTALLVFWILRSLRACGSIPGWQRIMATLALAALALAILDFGSALTGVPWISYWVAQVYLALDLLPPVRGIAGTDFLVIGAALALPVLTAPAGNRRSRSSPGCAADGEEESNTMEPATGRESKPPSESTQ